MGLDEAAMFFAQKKSTTVEMKIRLRKRQSHHP